MAYIPKLNPVVGGGLGGLPEREDRKPSAGFSSVGEFLFQLGYYADTDISTAYPSTRVGFAFDNIGMVAYFPSYGNDKVFSLDVSDPKNISKIGETGISSIDGPVNIVHFGNFIYVASILNESITSFDVSDPSNIIELDTITDALFDNPAVMSIDNVRQVLYVTSTGTNNTSAIDISNPSALSILSSTGRAGDGSDYDSDVLYVVDSSAGILMSIDASNPSALPATTLDSLGGLSTPWDIKVSGNYAYVLSTSDRLYVVDISDPTNMSVVGEIFEPQLIDNGQSIEIYNDNAFITCNNSGSVSVIDISDPLNVEFKTSIQSYQLDVPRGISVIDGLVLVQVAGDTSTNAKLTSLNFKELFERS